MALYNLYLVLNNERIKIYDNLTKSIVYVGSSEFIPNNLMNKLVHDMTIEHDKDTNRLYFLLNIN